MTCVWQWEVVCGLCDLYVASSGVVVYEPSVQSLCVWDVIVCFGCL